LLKRAKTTSHISNGIFQCEWDPEHGLAAITHEDRIIDLDRGETDPWKIYEDNGTLAEKQKEYDEQEKNTNPE
jgi:hypothetical protein